MKIHQIHDCLNIVCDVESDVFDSSFKGLFRKKDYIGNDGKLESALVKLIEIHDGLVDFNSGYSGVDMVAEDAKNYAYALGLSTAQLVVINRKLALKSRGETYSMTEYNSEVNQFHQLQEQYMSLGAKLNVDYKLYAYEIANLED
jgi:hypothetical protein